MRISFIELQAENSATIIGILWVPLTTVLFALALALLFQPLHAFEGSDFFLYVLVGYSLWQFIAATINSSVDLVRRQFDNAVHNGLGLAGLYLKALSDRGVEWGLNLVICAIAVIALNPIGSWKVAVLVLPAIVLVLMTSLAVSYLVSVAAILVPDLGKLIKTGTRFLFFLSPVFWAVGSTDQPIRLAIYGINPITYYLEVIRQAFGVEPVSAHSWFIASAITVAVTLGAWVLFSKTRSMVTNIK